jgi:hypothetical protein
MLDRNGWKTVRYISKPDNTEIGSVIKPKDTSHVGGGLIDKVSLKINHNSWNVEVRNAMSTYGNIYTKVQKYKDDVASLEAIILRLFTYTSISDLTSVRGKRNITLILIDTAGTAGTAGNNTVVDQHGSYCRFPYFQNTTFSEISEMMKKNGLLLSPTNTKLVKISKSNGDMVAIVRARDVDILNLIREVMTTFQAKHADSEKARYKIQNIRQMHGWATQDYGNVSETSSKLLMDLFQFIDTEGAIFSLSEENTLFERMNISFILLGYIHSKTNSVMSRTRPNYVSGVGKVYEFPVLVDVSLVEFKTFLQNTAQKQLNHSNYKFQWISNGYVLIFKCEIAAFDSIFSHIKNVTFAHIPSNSQIEDINFEEMYMHALRGRGLSPPLIEIFTSNIRQDGSIIQ